MATITTASDSIEVDDLDGKALREVVSGNAALGLTAARDRYVVAYQWCISHPPADEYDVATLGDAGLPGLRECDTRVGGDGTPGVSGLAVTEYAALAGISPATGIRVLSDTLDLHHRLPGLWVEVDELRVPAWKAARVAELTHGLSAEAAAWIDQRLADTGRYGWSSIEAAVKQATARFHPELIRPEGPLGRDDWDVVVDHEQCADGTSRLEATGDSLDLAKFHDLVCDEAAVLQHLGDTDGLGQRKAKALGVIADRQATLDLEGTPDRDGNNDGSHDRSLDPSGDTGCASGTTATGIRPRRSYLRPKLYLHLPLSDLYAHASGEDPTRVGDAGFLGQQLISQIEAWLVSCGSDAKVTPVIDLNKEWAIDQHDPPALMREQVILRDQTCVFPSCAVDARRCDMEHIDGYVEDGPPGQTSPDQLAAVCRRHHRLKTFTAWTYHRDPDDQLAYVWTSPHGERWRVTPGHGTIRLDDDPGRRRRTMAPEGTPGPPNERHPPRP